MSELNREDIIKALECCSKHPMRCAKCPYQVVSCCTNEHRKDALTLIKQLTEENERLKEKADRSLDNLKAVLEERSRNEQDSETKQ